MTKSHKHKDLIIAWADGAEIQSREPLNHTPWEDDQMPMWLEQRIYRIKPEEKKPVVRWLWADKRGYISATLCTEEESYQPYKIKLEWSRTEFPE